jgi:polyribonucleotide nucleotidyltransferase
VASVGEPLIKELLSDHEKMVRQRKRSEAITSVIELLNGEYGDRGKEIKEAIYDLEKKMVRSMALEEGKRIDGRSFKDVRPIECLVGVDTGNGFNHIRH